MIAVLFDMDGTLLDLDVEMARVRADLEQMFRPLGYRGGFRPILPCIDRAAERAASDPKQRDALVRRARGIIDAAEVRAARSARARPGARESLRRLANAGIHTGLLTDNGRACVRAAFEAARFDEAISPEVIVTRDDAPPKPDPEGVVQCARQLLPAGGSLWLVGDSPRDIEAGRAAGRRPARAARVEVVCVAVLGGRGSEEALCAAGPAHVARTLSELWSLEPWHVR